jgi:taurine dioxygenase
MSAAMLDVRPMAIGAEVEGWDGLDLADPQVRAALYGAWLDHGILLFHGVDSIDRHLALSRCFGELEIHPFPEAHAAENPLFIEIGGSKVEPAYLYDETEVRVNRIPWHRDTAYTPGICKGAMLRMVEAPERGGETLFADTARAYDALSPAMKATLETLEYKATLRLGAIDQTRPGALWKTVRVADVPGSPAISPNYQLGVELRYPSVVQPAILTHPESGRKCIFLSPTYVDFFLGLDQAESNELLEALVEHMTGPDFVQKHRWAVNDAIVWDNRRMMHAGVGNEVGQRRRGLRTTLAGHLETGRLYDEARPITEDMRVLD